MVKELKYEKISIGDLLKDEIAKNTEMGQFVQSSIAQKEQIPNDIISSILVKSLLNTKSAFILIVGFPITLSQAQYFEENIFPINQILHFSLTEETSLKRLSAVKGKEGEIQLENHKEEYAKSNEELQQILNFYKAYGVVREIDAEKGIGAVYEQFKQSLYPEIYTIIGKKYSGKTEISKMMKNRMGFALIDYANFMREKEIMKRAKDTEFVVGRLIAKIKKMECSRVLIEDFPRNKEEYSYFVNNCKQFEKIYYLNEENCTALERLNALDINNIDYMDCSELNNMIYEFEQRAPFIEFIKKKANVMEIDVNNHKELTIERMMKEIQPYCIIIKASNDLAECKKSLIDKLIANYNFEVVDIQKVIENAKSRNIEIALNDDNITIETKIALIRPILFRAKYCKYILENFPTTLNDLNSFEQNLCSINKMIYISNEQTLPISQSDENDEIDPIEPFFKSAGNFVILPGNELTDFQIEESLDMTRDINIVYGMPLSGKTAIAKHLNANCGFSLLDFKELIEVVKNSKKDPENEEAEVEITFKDLVEGLKNYLNKLDKDKRIVVDNVFSPNVPEMLIDTIEKAQEIIKTIGIFRNLYEMECKEETLISRYKAKEGINEDLGEEQMNAFNEMKEKPKKLLEEITLLSSNVIKVNTDDDEEITKLRFDFTFGRNIILIKHEYDINIEKSLEFFACQNRILYINVPKLLYYHFAQNDNDSRKLEDCYGKKILSGESEDKNDFEKYIYYKYNPIHFDINLVNELILKYANERYKEIENSGNFLILTGYLNNDLLPENDLPFNLPMLEIKNAMVIGDLTAFIQVSRKDIKQEEDEEAILLEEEKPKKVKERDPLDVDEVEGGEGENAEQEAQNEQGGEEEENQEGVVKFKPQGLSWTNYDGVPRNYVQVVKRLKRYPVNVTDLKLEDINKEIREVLKTHLEKFIAKEKDYTGIIQVMKVVEEDLNNEESKL